MSRRVCHIYFIAEVATRECDESQILGRTPFDNFISTEADRPIRVKIGCSYNPPGVMKMMAADATGQLYLAASIAADSDFATRIRAKYVSKRQPDGWFMFTSADLTTAIDDAWSEVLEPFDVIADSPEIYNAEPTQNVPAPQPLFALIVASTQSERIQRVLIDHRDRIEEVREWISSNRPTPGETADKYRRRCMKECPGINVCNGKFSPVVKSVLGHPAARTRNNVKVWIEA